MLWDLFPVEENCVRLTYLIPECSLAPFKHRLKLFGIYDCLAPNDDRLLVRTLSKGPTPCLSDPRILFAVKGAHVILDTAVRFADGDENSANDMARGLATDIFALLGSLGARSVIAAHHSPKPFARKYDAARERAARLGRCGRNARNRLGGEATRRRDEPAPHRKFEAREIFSPAVPFKSLGARSSTKPETSESSSDPASAAR